MSSKSCSNEWKKVSKQNYESVDILYQARHFNGACNRLYFCVFQLCYGSLLRDKKIDRGPGCHERVMKMLNDGKTVIIPKQMMRVYRELLELRVKADYHGMLIVEDEYLSIKDKAKSLYFSALELC